MTGHGWAIRLHEAADEIVWSARLTLLWTVFALAGGVVLGIGPATVAAYSLARRHGSGESFRAGPAFAGAYRREFRRGSLLVLPLAAAIALLTTNYFYFATLGPPATAPRLITLAALAAVVTIATHLVQHPRSGDADLRRDRAVLL